MLRLSRHDVLICHEGLWLLISNFQFWPPAACGDELHPLRSLHGKSCSPGGLNPLPDSWRVPHNGSGGQLFLWELASAEKKLHTLCGGVGGRGGWRLGWELDLDIQFLSWQEAGSCFGSLLSSLYFDFTSFACSVCVSLYSLCLVTYSAWKLPIFRPTGQQEVPKSFLVSFLALANL